LKIELELNKKYRQGLEELKQEIEQDTPGWIKARRKEYLLGEMLVCIALIRLFEEWYQEATERGADYLTKRIIKIFFRYEQWKKRFYKLIMEYKFTILRKPGKNRITSYMIDRARDYPISDIIKVNKKYFALCPEHDDHRPSMDCRNNFCYCYVCGFRSDSLGLYMKIHNVDFATAVKFLSKGGYDDK